MTSLAGMRRALAAVDRQNEDALDAMDAFAAGDASSAWARIVSGLTPETYGPNRAALVSLVAQKTTEGASWFAETAREHVAAELDTISPAARRTAANGSTWRTPDYDARQLAEDLAGRLDALVRDAKDVPGTLLAESHQFERIVQTESFRSYNRSRGLLMDALRIAGDQREYVVTAGEQARDAGDWIPGILKVWSATLDKRACPRCKELHGSVRLLGMAFDGEADPPLHPRCRCRCGFFPIAVPRRK